MSERRCHPCRRVSRCRCTASRQSRGHTSRMSERLDHQSFPGTGPLATQMNWPLAQLCASTGAGADVVYSYVVATVAHRDGRFVQRGSAPNWPGGALTLCTCKHHLRTFLAPEAWRGVWVAGFTGLHAGDRRNALVFLTRVAFAAVSHQELWHSAALTGAAKRAKDASRHVHGDLFRPASSPHGPFDPRAYVRPRPDHDHAKGDGWRDDIGYESRGGRRPALLVGDAAHTYLYARPMLYTPQRLGRGQRKGSLRELLDGLGRYDT